MKSHTLKLFFLLSIIIVSACDTQPVKPGQTSAEDTRPVTEKQLSLTEEAERLLELAEDSNTETEQLEYRVQAARIYIEANIVAMAKQQLAAIKNQVGYEQESDKKVSAPAMASISLLSAEIAIAEKNAVLASTIITDIKPITREQQIHLYELKAELDFLSGKYMYAVDRRVQLDAYLSNEKDKERNNRKIWSALSNLPNVQLDNQQSKNPTIQGWLDLAKVMRSGQQKIDQL